MYWNNFYKYKSTELYKDKLQHEMYWNTIIVLVETSALLINYNMRCIETTPFNEDAAYEYEINYNMRCIETK